MDQIADAADISRATLFNYFPAKGEIADALVAESDEYFFTSMDAWRNAPSLNTGERLLGIFTASAHFLQRDSARRRVQIGLSWMNWSNTQSAARIRRVSRAFGILLECGVANGDVSGGLDIELAADLVSDTYMGLVRRFWCEENFPIVERCDGAARMLASFICPGLEVPEKAPLPPPVGPQKRLD